MELNLNHMNVSTNDLPASQAFYEKYFEFVKKYEAGGETFLENKTGFLLALLPLKEPAISPVWLHYGFTVDSADQVKKLYERMKADGIEFYQDLTEQERFCVFYAKEPGSGHKVEVGCWSGWADEAP